MEYLVTMTTRVPDGTPEQAVTDIRTREAARSRELAAQGHLLRLWRPPLQPGEWRTLGHFAAADDAKLEKVLASMPLRVWRTDQVTPLSPHPNDPVPAPPPGPPEFLTTFTLAIPEGTPARTVDDTHAREADSARELARQGLALVEQGRAAEAAPILAQAAAMDREVAPWLKLRIGDVASLTEPRAPESGSPPR